MLMVCGQLALHVSLKMRDHFFTGGHDPDPGRRILLEEGNQPQPIEPMFNGGMTLHLQPLSIDLQVKGTLIGLPSELQMFSVG
jgi:hypothetical protein